MAAARSPDALVTTDWLAAHGADPDVRVVDGTSYLPTENRDARAEYGQAHIPGAVFFDIDAISDRSSSLPHMFPDAVTFGTAVGALGIGNEHTVICYDNGKQTGAARVWWMFRAFGHPRVAVLDGGLRKWLAEGRPVESGGAEPAPARFEARIQADLVCSLDQVARALQDGSAQVVDARSAGRFHGTAPEPRAGLRAGHMPGALNLPYDRLLRDTGEFRSGNELERVFAEAGVTPGKPVITSCGSGISAATLLLGLHLIGRDDGALYDGSWAEWGSRRDTPVVTE